MKNFSIKIVLTLLLVLFPVSEYLESGQIPGGLQELQYLGVFPSVLCIALFFVAIALYCRSLQGVLECIHPKHRVRTPKSVWYMYVMPFNFIEDFFIVIDLARSLENEMRINPRLHSFGDFGLTLGIGWAIAQLFSFVPNEIGQVSGLVGLVFWIAHWILLSKIKKVLLETTP